MAAPTSSPVNVGHAYANDADDLEDREQWDKAAASHSLAAEQFQKAIVYAQDPEAVKTLRLLVMNHTRKAKALARKAAKVNEAQTSKRELEGSSPVSYSSSSSKPADIRSQSLPSRLHNLNVHHNQGYHERMTSTSYPTIHHSHLLDSGTQAIDESYALLNDQNEDDSDPFNKFWTAVETLVQKLSNPVAFASVPLNEEDDPNALIEENDVYSAQKKDQPPANKPSTKSQIEASMMESFIVVPHQASNSQPTPQIHVNNFNKEASVEKPIPAKTLEEYAVENRSLKNTVDILSRQVAYWKKAAEEGNVLKSSILQFRNDVQKQAKRIMQSQESMKSSMVYGQYGANSLLFKQTKSNESSSVPATNPQARIKELEDELMALRLENNRQKDLMGKYKERWEKLKESAKKRRAQPSQAESSAGDQKSPFRLEENSRPTQLPARESGEPKLLKTLAQQSQNHHVVQSVQTSLPPFASIAPLPSRLRYERNDNSDEEV